MNKFIMKKYLHISIVIILFVISLWNLLWIFSSASLASGFCNNEFDLFHENFRCRQPYIASILFVIFLILSIVVAYFGFRQKKNKE